MTIRNGGGDREWLFNQLYKDHYAHTVRYLRGYRLDREDAEDLAQEVFLRINNSLDQYREEAGWGFVQRIARNLLINWWRDRNAKKRTAHLMSIDDPDFQEPAAPEGPDYAEREEAAIRVERLHGALRKLPDGQQKCILLQLDDLTYDQISGALKISPDAVKSRRRDALRKLRETLGNSDRIEWPDTLPEEER